VRLSATRGFPLALAALLAALSFWLERTVRQEEPHPALRRHDPDYVAENFILRRFGADGAEHGLFAAARMVHYPDDDTTELLAPRIVQSRPGEPRLTITAERGTLAADGEEFFLYDNVLVVREARGEQPEARMTTEFLHVQTARGLVRTDREVTIRDRDRELAARGMVYHYEQGRFELEERVRGRYGARGRSAP